MTFSPVNFFFLTLQHESVNDPVEDGAFVVELLAALGTDALLPRDQAAEVLRGLGTDVAEQLHDDPANGCLIRAKNQVEPDLGIGILPGAGGLRQDLFVHVGSWDLQVIVGLSQLRGVLSLRHISSLTQNVGKKEKKEVRKRRLGFQ